MTTSALTLRELAHNAGEAMQLDELGRSRNLAVLGGLVRPAVRGLVLKRGKAGHTSVMPTAHDTTWRWDYARDQAELGKLTAAARRGQWDPDADLDWSTSVDPADPARPLFKPGSNVLEELPGFLALPADRQAALTRDFLGWMLSQFMHGEQGALFVACQLTQAVGWTDGKLYGATQVMDEGRHLEVFDRYVARKLEKRYAINDYLYVMLDALMTDPRWDIKFLGMQILVEGLALGAFTVMRQSTGEPLLSDLLKLVITDEARHVHFGVVALSEARAAMSDADRRDREDWAYEMCVIMRNRFLAHEFYEEHWAHILTRQEWDRVVQETTYMRRYRDTMFRRVIPNLKRIGLLSDRVRPYYAQVGLLGWEHEKAAPDLSADELLRA